jgi:GMP synthase-like glutamine amidotransferase
VLVVQHEADTGPGSFGPWLRAAGVDLEVHHPYLGAVLPEGVLDDVDGLLVLGGAMGPEDDERCPWLPATRSLLVQAVRRALPTFGICLGAELLVVACGGEVRRGVAGPELGVLGIDPLPAAAEDLVGESLRPGSRVVQWHWEEMSRLPEDSTLLATGSGYPHQVFRVGAAAWGVQGHPEVTVAIAQAWAREEAPLLVAAGRWPEELVAEVAANQPTLAATWRPVAEAFAGVVRGTRPAAGVPRADVAGGAHVDHS